MLEEDGSGTFLTLLDFLPILITTLEASYSFWKIALTKYCTTIVSFNTLYPLYVVSTVFIICTIEPAVCLFDKFYLYTTMM